MAIINGTAYWTHIAAPNDRGDYPSNKYEITVGNLDNESIQTIKGLGMAKSIQNKGDEKGSYVRVKNDKRPRFFDKDKVDYPLDTLLGNGSKVKVQIGTYTMPKFGLQIDLKAIQVLEFVEYKGKRQPDLSEFEDESPFEVSA